MKTFLKPITAVMVFLCVAAAGTTANSQTQRQKASPSDVKLRTKMTAGSSDRGMETVIYKKGPRMRSEMANAGMEMININQCDLKRTIMINNKTRTYLIMNDGEKPAWGVASEGDGGAAPTTPANAQPVQPRRGGVVTVTNTMNDTGERRELFGFTARHIKTSTVQDASPDACNKSHKSETDGWYIDFQYQFECPGQKAVHPVAPDNVQRDCEDEIRTRSIGTAKLGYPVLLTTTSYRPDGKTSTMTQEVIELSREPLDAALFEVPEGYALAKNMQELYGMTNAMAGSGGGTNSAAGSSAAVSSSTSSPAPGMNAAGAPKKAGALRIGIVTPKAQMTSGNSAQAAEAVRNTFASFLNGPTIEVVSLTARLPSQALEEARLGQCDYVLYTSLTQKKGGGGGMFGRALGSVGGIAVGHIPVNTRGEAAARSVAVSGIHTTANVAGSIKAKDELSLEYKLESTDGARPGMANTAKGKAKSDGEDVLTPLVERAAEAVVAAATKK